MTGPAKRVLGLNLKGSFVAAQEMAQQLFKLERPGKVTNIGSMTAYQALWHTAAYFAIAVPRLVDTPVEGCHSV